MLVTWLMTFLTAPIAIALIDPPRHGEPHTKMQSVLLSYFSHPLRPRVVAAAAILITLGIGAIGAKKAFDSGFYDMNILNLRSTESLKSGGASWDRRMSELFGVWLNPVVGLVEDPADREPMAAALDATMVKSSGGLAERVETIEKYVPKEAEQLARIERLSKVKKSLEQVDPKKIPAKAKPYIDAWLSEANLRPIKVEDVPQILKQGFTETNGRTDRVVLLYPSLGIDYNNGHNILRFVDKLSTATVPPKSITAGSFLFMAEIIRLVRNEAPKVMLMVCLLVGLALLPIIRKKAFRIPLVVGTVGVVAVSAQLVMFAVGVQLNMLNFAAVPITIGVGSDYVVNLLGAMDAFGVNAKQACARMGGAIFLCSLTTVVGYTTLLLAHSGALRSFGWAAVLGELMAVTTVLLVLPVFFSGSDAEQAAPSAELAGAGR
jgi:hypothetical protein